MTRNTFCPVLARMVLGWTLWTIYICMCACDSIQGLGPLKVSRGSKIHKMRNIAFGIIQMHFCGVLHWYLAENIKKHVKNITFSKIFGFLGQILAKNHHFTGQI